jgi:formylmethanofuran dehydrogenase subunit D
LQGKVAAVISLHPSDAEGLGVSDGDAVTIRNEHGAIELVTKLDAQVRPGTAWIPESLPGAPVGALLNGSTLAAVNIEKP